MYPRGGQLLQCRQSRQRRAKGGGMGHGARGVVNGAFNDVCRG